MAKVTAEQLLKPQGDIDAALLFPEDTPQVVRDQINSWLAKGYSHPALTGAVEADANRAVENFAYAKAYSDVHTRMSASPIRAGVSGEADQAFEVAQIREFAAKAAAHLDAFNAILAEIASVTIVEPARSRTLLNTYHW